MASFTSYAPKLKAIEGGYVVDSGGPTNWGITLSTLQAVHPSASVADIKALTWPQAAAIYKRVYWDALRADSIRNQSIAEVLVDFSINGWPGVRWLQSLLGVSADGQLGPRTLAAINKANPTRLHQQLVDARQAYYAKLIASNPAKYARYQAAWSDRMRQFAYQNPVATSSGTLLFALAVGSAVYYYVRTT